MSAGRGVQDGDRYSGQCRVAGLIQRGFVFGLLMFAWGAAVAAPPVIAHLRDNFQEALRDDVVVSGVVIVGVADAAVLDGTALRALAISPGLAEGAQVCLAVTTRDGVYAALNSFVVLQATSPGQSVVLPYDRSKYLARLGRYADTEISALASAGQCGSPASTHYLVHRASAAGGDTIRLFVNSFGATDVYASASGPATDCDPITEGRRTSFDYICSLTLGPKDHGAFNVTVQRERYGRALPDVSIRLLRGD